MPSYCGEVWVDASLRTIANEAAEGIEVIIVDGSQSPVTRNIAKTFSDRLCVRIFERCDLSSWQKKTNFGVQIATSPHICWLGVDDVWLPGRAASVRAWIESSPDTILHLAPTMIIDKVGRDLSVWHCPLRADCELSSKFIGERLIVQNFVGAPAPVFHRDAWLACGGLDESLWYAADWDIWLKLAALGPVRYHDAVTVGFRIHGESLTSTGSREAADFENQLRLVLERHLPKMCGSKATERIAYASIAVNAALAAAASGARGGLIRAASEVLRLGPIGMHQYLRDSRILERTLPRVRAKLAGNL